MKIKKITKIFSPKNILLLVFFILFSFLLYVGFSLVYYRNISDEKLFETIVRELKKGYTNLGISSRVRLIMLLDSSIKRHPNSAWEHSQLGAICENENVPIEYAFFHYRKALQLGSDKGVELRLAKILLYEGKKEEALKYADQVYQSADKNWADWFGVAMIYSAAGCHRRSLECSKKSIEELQKEIEEKKKAGTTSPEEMQFLNTYKKHYENIYFLLTEELEQKRIEKNAYKKE
jgi:tetratricopeptide (TPR) repeat protein